MNTRETVAKRLSELSKEKGFNINSLAEWSGVPPSTLKNILNGGSMNPGIVTLKKLCDGLDMTLGEFFSTSEFNNLEQEIK